MIDVQTFTRNQGETPGDFIARLDQATAEGSHLIDVEDDYYHQCEAMSQTRLKRILTSAKLFHYRETHPEEPTPAMKFGTMVHRALLEPERFNQIYVEGPDVKSKNSKRWKDFVESMPDNEVLKPSEMEEVREIVKSVKSHDLAMSYLSDGLKEVSGYGTLAGRKVRCRADNILPERKIITDFKTTGDCSPRKFTAHAYDMGYFIQAPWYLDIYSQIFGFKFEKFVFVSVDKTPPYDIQVYVAEMDFLKRGRADYMLALSILEECEKTDQWPGYPQQVLNLSLPRWAN